MFSADPRFLKERQFIIGIYIYSFFNLLFCEPRLEDTSDVKHLIETVFKKELILMLQVLGEWNFTANSFLLILAVKAL